MRLARSVTWALGGGVGLMMVLYAIQAAAMGDPLAPFGLFKEKWYFIAPLVIGFSYQIGVVYKLKALHHAVKSPLVASGSSSGVAMAACCMHNVVPLFPFLGLSGIAGVLSLYQDWVFGVSVGITALSAMYMTNQLKKCTIHQDIINKL